MPGRNRNTMPMNDNAQIQRNLEEGEYLEIGDTVYHGGPPLYVNVNKPPMPPRFVKAIRGVPFVRAKRQKED